MEPEAHNNAVGWHWNTHTHTCNKENLEKHDQTKIEGETEWHLHKKLLS